MKKLEQTWRWYGPNDPVSLADIRQAGATGVVSALHHVPNGEVWTRAEINKRKTEIEAAGLTWSVVESVPITEDIKLQTGDYKRHLENYATCIRNLAAEGVMVITYNFMPVLDWTRTNLNYRVSDGSTALRFEIDVLAAIDIYMVERANAAADYNDEIVARAKQWMEETTPEQQQEAFDAVIAGLPGAEAGYSAVSFREKLDQYKSITPERFRQNLIDFLAYVVPVASEVGAKMVIHPDDPPFSIFGLPRIVSTAADVQALFDGVPDMANGLCFCTGSFGVRADNDLVAMARQFSDRINFVHLRATKRDDQGNFHEADHLDGDVDMYGVLQALVEENQRRAVPIPFRPDHGHRMLNDLRSENTFPGYTAIGRLRGLAELRGIEYAILRAGA